MENLKNLDDRRRMKVIEDFLIISWLLIVLQTLSIILNIFVVLAREYDHGVLI